jgi:hypothetical protein
MSFSATAVSFFAQTEIIRKPRTCRTLFRSRREPDEVASALRKGARRKIVFENQLSFLSIVKQEILSIHGGSEYD